MIFFDFSWLYDRIIQEGFLLCTLEWEEIM